MIVEKKDEECKRTIIIVVKMFVRVFGVIDNEGTTQTIAVLVRIVRVVPKRAGLSKKKCQTI